MPRALVERVRQILGKPPKTCRHSSKYKSMDFLGDETERVFVDVYTCKACGKEFGKWGSKGTPTAKAKAAAQKFSALIAAGKAGRTADDKGRTWLRMLNEAKGIKA